MGKPIILLFDLFDPSTIVNDGISIGENMLKRNNLRFTKAYIGLNGSGPLHTQAVTGFGPVELDELNFLLYKRMRIVVTMYYSKWIDRKIMAIHMSPLLKKKSKHKKIKYTSKTKMTCYQKSNYNRYVKRDLIRKSIRIHQM